MVCEVLLDESQVIRVQLGTDQGDEGRGLGTREAFGQSGHIVGENLHRTAW